MRVALVAGLVAVAGVVPVATANAASVTPVARAAVTTSVTWSKLSPQESPNARSAALEAFDPATGQLVLYGGGGLYFATANYDDTFTFDGASWTSHLTKVTPAQGINPELAYDPASRQVVLFNSTGTFTWNGSQWAKQHPTASPAGFNSCMATDDATGQVILFSNSPVTYSSPRGGTATPAFSGTWTWRSDTWVQLSTVASPPVGACEMTFDGADHELVLVNADPDYGDTPDLTPVLQTWTFDGTWTQQQSAGAPTGSVDFHSMSYDPALGEVVTFGGFGVNNGNVVFTNPWGWNGSTWTPVALSPQPPAREVGAMAYDGATGQLVLFGGAGSTNYLGDTWVLTAGRVAATVTSMRLAGADRETTAVAMSQAQYPTTGSASAVVLAREDLYPDALAGGPLAAAKHAPLLLTSSASLDNATKAEIIRVLPAGGTVYLLGGTAALSDAVSAAITALGDVAQRIAGTDRFDTSIAIAGALGNPGTVFEASGLNFPDALSAVPAAITRHGAILLTDGSAQAPATTTYLAAHATSRYAVGGPAAWADPSAIALAGEDRYATSDAVASAFFPTATRIAVASGVSFPDALAGGVLAGNAAEPVLLVPPNGNLSEPDLAYLNTRDGSVGTISVFGGAAALSDLIAAAVTANLH